MTNKPVYIVGRHPRSEIKKGTPTQLLQAQTLGYLKVFGKNSPVMTFVRQKKVFKLK